MPPQEPDRHDCVDDAPPKRKPTAAPGSNRFVAQEDEIEMGGTLVSMTGKLPPTPEQLRRKP